MLELNNLKDKGERYSENKKTHNYHLFAFFPEFSVQDESEGYIVLTKTMIELLLWKGLRKVL